jgi:tRNA(Ile2) C34 agmatinyltransferase TiaS
LKEAPWSPNYSRNSPSAHASPVGRTTAKVYAHLLDDSQLDALASAHERKMLGKVLGEKKRRPGKRATKPITGGEGEWIAPRRSPVRVRLAP